MPPTTISSEINFPYTAVDLTQAIEVIPNQYGRLQELDVFPTQPITTTVAEVRFRDGVLTILAHEERGAPGTAAAGDAEHSIYLPVPHIPHMDTLRPEDLQSRFSFGSRDQRRGIEEEMTRKLRMIRNKHAITLEFLRMGALKGQIIDGKNIELHNLFDVFGVTQKSVDFLLGTGTTDVAAKCREVVRHMELNLLGEIMSGVRCLVSQEFFDKLIAHPNVEKFYVNWQGAQQLQGNDPRRGFPFGGIIFEEYLATASDLTGTSRRFIAANEGHAWPLGTMDTFATHFAPAHHINTVNTLGTEVFVSPEILKHGQGVELKSESNPLPICRRPALLVKVNSSN